MVWLEQFSIFKALQTANLEQNMETIHKVHLENLLVFKAPSPIRDTSLFLRLYAGTTNKSSSFLTKRWS